ncbi:MAG: hypothetical protein ACLQPD_30870 [Desulfomonilaceae bacterium]
MRILGIDPAPGKGLSVFDPYRPDNGEVFYQLEARKAKIWFNKLVESSNRQIVIGWDAPLSADFSATYTRRPIEELLWQKWSAAAVQGFSTCQHWTISIDLLGRPLPSDRVKEPDDRIPLLDEFQARTANFGIIETHPAVAMAVMWPKGQTFPKYKGVNTSEERSAIQTIQIVLRQQAEKTFATAWTEFPELTPAGMNQSDLLDAQISFLEVMACRTGRAIMLGDVFRGGFAVPRTAVSTELHRKYWHQPENRVKIDTLSPGEAVLSAEKIAHYREALERDELLPPVRIYCIQDRKIVRDGNNRVRAYVDHCRANGRQLDTVPFIL